MARKYTSDEIICVRLAAKRFKRQPLGPPTSARHRYPVKSLRNDNAITGEKWDLHSAAQRCPGPQPCPGLQNHLVFEGPDSRWTELATTPARRQCSSRQ